MTGTVPRSFIVPTSFLPAASARRKRSSSESKKFHSRSAAAELSIRSLSKRTIALGDVPPQRPAIVGLAQPGRAESGVTRVPLGQRDSPGCVVHASISKKASIRPSVRVAAAVSSGPASISSTGTRAPLFQPLQLGVPEVAPDEAAEDDPPHLRRPTGGPATRRARCWAGGRRRGCRRNRRRPTPRRDRPRRAPDRSAAAWCAGRLPWRRARCDRRRAPPGRTVHSRPARAARRERPGECRASFSGIVPGGGWPPAIGTLVAKHRKGARCAARPAPRQTAEPTVGPPRRRRCRGPRS